MDINEVLAEMLEAIKAKSKGIWPQVKPYANKYMESRKQRFALLADLRLKNHISEEDLLSRLQDEEDLLEVELHNIAIVKKEAARDAAKVAINVLKKAIEVVVGKL